MLANRAAVTFTALRPSRQRHCRTPGDNGSIPSGTGSTDCRTPGDNGSIPSGTGSTDGRPPGRPWRQNLLEIRDDALECPAVDDVATIRGAARGTCLPCVGPGLGLPCDLNAMVIVQSGQPWDLNAMAGPRLGLPWDLNAVAIV